MMGKALIVAGAVLIAVGLVALYGPHIPLLGKLPRDFTFERKGVRIVFPIATSILLSLALTLLLNWFRRR